MKKGRLEAFSDGGIAILSTIMVLELHMPAGHDWASLRPLALHDEHSVIAQAIGSDIKGRLSLVLYAVAIAAALYRPWIACAIYVAVAIVWLVPDRRIESRVGQ